MRTIADRSVSVRLRGDVTHFVNQLKRAGREVDDLARKARGIGPVQIRVEVDDQTGPALTSIERRLQGLGPVKVRVEIDDQTQSDISAISARLASLGPVDIALRIDDQTAASIAAVEARLRSLGPIDIGVRLDNQTSGSLAALRARLNSLGPYMVRVGLNVQTAALAVLQARIAALGPYDVPVGLNLQPGALAALRARLASLGPFQVQIELELDPWAINDIRTRLAALGGVSVPINAHFDGHAGLAASWAEFERFRLLASRLLNIPVTAHDNLDVGLGQAYAEMLMFRQLAERTLRIPVTTSGGVNFPNLGGALGKAGQAGSQGLKMAAGIIAALPALSVAAAGALTLGLGAAFAGIPIYFAAQSDKVRDEWQDLRVDLESGFGGAAKPFEDELIDISGVVREMAHDWKPLLTDVFADLAPSIGEFADDFRVGLNSFQPMIKDLSSAFTTLLDNLGPQLPGIFDSIGQGFSSLFQAIEDDPQVFTDMIRDLGGLIEIVGALGGILYDIYPSVNFLAGVFGGLAEGVDTASESGQNAINILGEMGQWMLSFAGGPVTIAIYGINKMKQAWDALRDPSSLLPPDYFDRIGGLGESLVGAAGSTGTFADAQANAIDTMKIAGMTADELKAALDRLTGANLNVWDSQTNAEKAVDAMTAAMKKNGRTLDSHTKAGQDNRDSLSSMAKKFQDYINAMEKSREPAKKIQSEAERMRKLFYAFALSLTGSKKEAEKLTNGLLGLKRAADKVPASKTAKLKGDLTDLQAKLNKAKSDLKTVPASKRSKLLANIADLEAKVKRVKAQLAGIPDQTVYINVIPRGTAAALQRAKDINYKGQALGSVRTFANGSEHHVAQIARPGEWRVWAEDETGGEAYIPLAGSKRARSEAILGDVANRFGLNLTRPMADGGVTFFADGGVTDAPLSGMLGSWRDLVKPTTAEDLKEALEARNDQAQSLADALEDLKAAREARVEAIKEAQESLAQARKDRAESIKEAKKRLAETRQSRKESITDAKRALRDAREQRADAIRDAKADLAEARKSTGKGKAARVADAQRKLTRAQRTDDVEKAQRDLKKASSTNDVKDAQADLVKAQKDNRVAKAQDELADAKRVAGLKAIEQAERRIRDARVDLAEATEKLLSVEDRRQFDLMRPGDQLSAALALGIRNTGAFIANLTALGDRGFGNLANQLLGMGGAEAEKMAADLASMPDWQVGNTQKQIETSQQQQAQLAALPETLKVRSALKSGGGSGWTNLLMATDLDPGTLAAVLKTMPDVGNTDQGKTLLADMAKHGYASGGWIGGIGGPTSDSNLIAASRDEFMVAAGPARKHGALLEAINDGRMPAVPRYAAGGWVGRPRGGDGAAAAPSMHLEQHFHEVPFTPSQMAREAAREAAWAIR